MSDTTISSKLIEQILGGKAQDGDVIAAQPLKFSSIAAFGSGLLGLAAVILPAIKFFADQQLTDTQLVAAVVILGASILGFALASAGDALARAYSAAWVIPQATPSGGSKVPAHPALQEVAQAVRATGVVRSNGGTEHSVLGDLAKALEARSSSPQPDRSGQTAVVVERALDALKAVDDELLAPLTPHQKDEFHKLMAKITR